MEQNKRRNQMITIDEVKRLNAERSQGAWFYNRSPMKIGDRREFPCIQIQTNPGIKKIVEFITKEAHITDAHFIAAAPDMANLAIQLNEENERYKKALEFYASEDIFRVIDLPSVATQALNKNKE